MADSGGGEINSISMTGKGPMPIRSGAKKDQ